LHASPRFSTLLLFFLFSARELDSSRAEGEEMRRSTKFKASKIVE
ncbi:MAG: hypothetical protein ACI81P_002245, partial [Neolewinella sp.]